MSGKALVGDYGSLCRNYVTFCRLHPGLVKISVTFLPVRCYYAPRYRSPKSFVYQPSQEDV
jgi:hypothetical protein